MTANIDELKALAKSAKRLMSEKHVFYRLQGVTKNGGTQADGLMMESHEDVIAKLSDWLRKEDHRDPFIVLSIIRVEKEYPKE